MVLIIMCCSTSTSVWFTPSVIFLSSFFLFCLQTNFARVGSLLKCIFSHTLWDVMERKTVRLASQPEIKVRKLLRMNSYYSSSESGGREEEEGEGLRCDDTIRDFIAPTICSLCSDSIAAVSREVDVNHSKLLLTMVRLYANPTLVRSVFSALESNHSQLIREYRGERILKQKLLVMCTVLSKAARLERGLREHAQFSEDVVEAVLLLLKCDMVDSSSAFLFLSELSKVGGEWVWLGKVKGWAEMSVANAVKWCGLFFCSPLQLVYPSFCSRLVHQLVTTGHMISDAHKCHMITTIK